MEGLHLPPPFILTDREAVTGVLQQWMVDVYARNLTRWEAQHTAAADEGWVPEGWENEALLAQMMRAASTD